MASGRDHNSPENYALEQWGKIKTRETILYEHSPNGQAAHIALPGNGLRPCRIANKELSDNWVDIDTMLKGISANNLVKPLPPVEPQLRNLPSLDIAERPLIPVVEWEVAPSGARPEPWTATPSAIAPRWQAFSGHANKNPTNV